jgi:hypothetical protein
VPGPTASGAAYSPKGNVAAIPSRPRQTHCKDHDGLSGHDFSRAANTSRSHQLQPLRPCFSNPLTDSSTKIKTPQNRKKPPKAPSNFVSVKNKPSLYFQQLPAILIEPMFRLERSAQRTQIETRNGVSTYAEPSGIKMAAPQRRV